MLRVNRPSIGPAEIEAVVRVCESGWLGMGEVTEQFEARVAEIVGAPHAIGVQSGTAALHLSLLAAGIGPGDEVIVPSFTFAASVQAILMAGATPVFCEVEERTLTIDVEDALARVTPATRAVLPVDYAGLACDYPTLVPEAHARDLLVVADSAHSFGSSCGGVPVGALADLTCFSFDATKNVTCGDGGIVSTHDDALADKLRLMRNLGIRHASWDRRDVERPWVYAVETAGFRYRLGNINAAIGLAQLDRMDGLRARKRAIVETYDAAFDGQPGLTLLERRLDETFPFLYALRVADGARDGLIAHLAARGVQGWVHFIPNHLQPAFAAHTISLPATEALYGEVVSLPLHSSMADHDVELVVEGVLSFVAERVAAGA